MGCYPYFMRIITEEEFYLMEDYCLQDAHSALKISPQNLTRQEFVAQLDFDPDLYYSKILRSWRCNEPCIDGFFWYQLGWGSNNPKLGKDFRTRWIENDLFVVVDVSSDIDLSSLRVVNYPHKIIHNKKELRRYLRKRYSSISNDVLDVLGILWKKYPGAILTWG